MSRVSPAALYGSTDYWSGLIRLSKRAAWWAVPGRAGTGSSYENPCQHSHYVTWHRSRPWLPASEVPPLPALQHHQKEKETKKNPRGSGQENFVILKVHSLIEWTQWERLFRGWENMKGQGCREKLELEALSLTKECEHGVWCVLYIFGIFFRSFLLRRDPPLTKLKLVQRC